MKATQLIRFTVTTRLNGKPPNVWRDKKNESPFETGAVRAEKDELGPFWVVDVLATCSWEAAEAGIKLIREEFN
jgi:hypothetical protein